MFFRMVYKSGPTFLPFGHKARVWQTDRLTDRQTDRRTDRILIARPRLHCMQRGEKGKFTHLGGSSVNKKLCYREEHSASVVLSWCTVWHLSGGNQQINS